MNAAIERLRALMDPDIRQRVEAKFAELTSTWKDPDIRFSGSSAGSSASDHEIRLANKAHAAAIAAGTASQPVGDNGRRQTKSEPKQRDYGIGNCIWCKENFAKFCANAVTCLKQACKAKQRQREKGKPRKVRVPVEKCAARGHGKWHKSGHVGRQRCNDCGKTRRIPD